MCNSLPKTWQKVPKRVRVAENHGGSGQSVYITVAEKEDGSCQSVQPTVVENEGGS